MSYQQLLKKLYQVNLFNPKKTDLSGMNKLYGLIGRPLEHIPVVSDVFLI